MSKKMRMKEKIKQEALKYVLLLHVISTYKMEGFINACLINYD